MTLLAVVREVFCFRSAGISALWVAVLLVPAAALQADSGNIEDILPLANDPNDPIGIERDPALDRAAAATTRETTATPTTPADRARFGPMPPVFAARGGEALTAVPSVRETSHRVELELQAGLALVAVELRFDNTADKPAEVEYRLAVPDDAALAGLEVCNPRGCRSGVGASAGAREPAYDDAIRARGPRLASEQLPLATAYPIRDARGPALILRAAPVERDRSLDVRVRYLSAAPLHGGVARVRLPARGMDPRAAPRELTLRSGELAELRVDGMSISGQVLKTDAWQSSEISARMAPASPGVRSVWHFPCGARQCARAYLSAPPLSAAPVDLVLAIDASPSTEGAARSRLLSALSAILARAPEGSRVRALRFASRARPLLAQRKDPGQLALGIFAEVAFEAELGSATRFEAAWELIRDWNAGSDKTKLRRVVAIVGDGGLTQGNARPFEAARKAGTEVSVVNVADRSTLSAMSDGARLTGGTTIDAGAEADQAARGGSAEPLEERMAALFAPVVIARPSLSGSKLKLPALRAGESLAIEELGSHAWTLRAGSSVRGSTSPSRLGFGLSVRGAEQAGLHDEHRQLFAVDPRDLGRGAHEQLRSEQARASASESATHPTHTTAKPARSGSKNPRAPSSQDRRAPESGSKATPQSPPTGESAGTEQTASSRAHPSNLTKTGSRCDRRGPALRQGGLSSDDRPVALAAERSACALPVPKPATNTSGEDDLGSAMPSSPLLGMLRQRILPVARGCFRRDRRGRADYQVRAVFEFELAEREVVSADVTGKITDSLRDCLLASVDQLAVPRFTGRVLVRYPLVTESETLPSQIELTPQTARRVDSLIAAESDSTP